MTDLLAACAALGVLLLYSGLTQRTHPSGRSRARVQAAITESGLRWPTWGRLVGLSILCALTGFLLVAAITESFFPSAALGLGSGWIPFAYVNAARARRRSALREAWPDALASMVAGIRAGVSLPEVCASMAERGPQELKAAFGSFAGIYRATGSFETAAFRLRVELADPVADRVVGALLLSNDVGGTDLVRVLRTLSDFVREDLRIRKEIEARWSWTVTAARMAAAGPWIVLLLMSTRPEAAAAYGSPGGGMVVLGGAVATWCGYRLMLRAARLPEDRRLVG